MQAKAILAALVAAIAVGLTASPAGADASNTIPVIAIPGPADAHPPAGPPVDSAADNDKLAKPFDPPASHPSKPRKRCRFGMRAYGRCMIR